jgi:hypothetical protein
MWDEDDVAKLKVLSQTLPGGTEKTTKILCQLRLWSRPRLEPGTFRVIGELTTLLLQLKVGSLKPVCITGVFLSVATWSRVMSRPAGLAFLATMI